MILIIYTIPAEPKFRPISRTSLRTAVALSRLTIESLPDLPNTYGYYVSWTANQFMYLTWYKCVSILLTAFY